MGRAAKAQVARNLTYGHPDFQSLSVDLPARVLDRWAVRSSFLRQTKTPGHKDRAFAYLQNERVSQPLAQLCPEAMRLAASSASLKRL